MFLRHRNSNDVSKKMENCPQCGGLSEWFMELVLKTSDGVKPTVSSNLTASANNNAHPKAGASKGCTIPENIGIVVKCGYAVFSCHSASGRSTAPMQL